MVARVVGIAALLLLFVPVASVRGSGHGAPPPPAAEPGGGHGGGHGGESAPKVERVRPSHVEVRLGEFKVPIRKTDTNTTIAVFCEVFVTVRGADLEDFELRLAERQARLRQELLVAIRRTTREELAEPSLAQLKKRLRAAVVSVIDAPTFQRLGFVSFNHAER